MSYHQEGSLVEMADPDLARDAVRRMAEVGGDYLFERVVENTPVSYTGLALQIAGFAVSRVPGTLKASWKRLPVEKVIGGISEGFQVPVETDDKVAPYVEWDTPPHEIRPKLPGGVLRFRAWPTGELVHTKLVHHPGTKGQHPMGLAVHRCMVDFEEITGPIAEDWALRTALKGAG